METFDKLNRYFNATLHTELESLEDLRKKILNRYYISASTLLIGILFLFIGNGKTLFFTIGFILIFLFFVSIWLLSKKEKIYKADFKKNVVKKIVELIDPDWRYEPNSYINNSEYLQSGIFSTMFDRYQGDDLIKGLIDKTDFQLSELHTEYKSVTMDHKGRKKEQWDTIFKGLFAHVDFNKKIKGKTFVLPDIAEKLLGKWGQNLQRNDSRGKLVKLENQEFEKHFVVYSEDQIEARYILTPKMMEAILDIRKKIKQDIYLSFVDSRVYVAISFSKDLFEPKILKSGVRYSELEKMYSHFNIITVIINEMNLNTRIWTKD